MSSPEARAVHLAHCNQGEYIGACKYHDADCPTRPQWPDSQDAEARLDAHLDAILRASGSALRHYTMAKSRDDMRAALRRAVQELGAPDQLLLADASAGAALRRAVHALPHMYTLHLNIQQGEAWAELDGPDGEEMPLPHADGATIAEEVDQGLLKAIAHEADYRPRR